MNKEKELKELKKELENERVLNKVFMAENVELKKINVGLKEAYEKTSKSYETILEERKKYERFFPMIDRIKKSALYRGLRKVKRIIRRG